MSSGLGLNRLREATFWRYTYLLAEGGLSLLLYVVLGRVLPTAGFTAASTALGIVVVTQTIGDFGLAGATVAVLPNRRSIGLALEPQDLRAGAAMAFLLAAPVAMVLCMLASLVVPVAAAGCVIAVAPTAAISIAVSGTDGILRSQGEFRRPVIVVALSRLGTFLGVPVALVTGSAGDACLAITAGTVVCSIPALAVLIVSLRRGNPRTTVRAFAAAAAPLGVSNAAIVASARLNTVILGGVSSLRAAAVFESAWRLFSVGQYTFGGAPSAAAPFIAHALSERSAATLRKGLRRATLLIVAGGGLFAAVIILGRGPIDSILFPSLGPAVGRSMLWLAPALPLNLLILLMSVTLAAVSRRERRWVAVSYLLGAVGNIGVLLMLVHGHPDVAGAAAASAGIVVSTVVLGFRLRVLLRNLKSWESDPTVSASALGSSALGSTALGSTVGSRRRPSFGLRSRLALRSAAEGPDTATREAAPEPSRTS